MNHPAELALHQYMENAVKGDSTISEDTIKQVANDVADAMRRQFGGGKGRGDFKMRMSNVGRPTCQLWYQKNKPEVALPFPNTFIMNMMLGDIVEAVFKGVLKEAGIKYEDSEKSPKGDIVSGINYCITVLKDPNSSKDDKVFYLKFLDFFAHVYP